MTTTPVQDLLTTGAVMAALKIDRSTVTRWVQMGHMTPVRRDPYLFDPAEVERVAAWCAETREQSA